MEGKKDNFSKLEEKLNSVGVRTRKFLNKNKLRTNAKILNSISKKWNKLSEEDKKEIIKLMTGDYK